MAEFKKYEYIDSLRGLAVLLVIMPHVGLIHLNLLPQEGIIAEIINNGKYGVELFFIASAFTLMLSYHNRRGETQATKKFFIRRFFRIAPLYYSAALLLVAYKLLSSTFGTKDLPDLFAHLFFVNAIIPKYTFGLIPGGWSISVEFIFYMLTPIFCKYIGSLDKCLRFTLVGLIVCFLLNSIVHSIPELWYFAYFSFIPHFPVFTFGFLAYWIVNSKGEEIKPISLLMLSFVIFFFCYFTIEYHWVYSLGLAALMVAQSEKTNKLFSNWFLAKIGKVSFSMYIVHFIVVLGLNKLNFGFIIDVSTPTLFIANYVLTYAIVVFLSYLISMITYRLIEIPGQNWGKRIIKRIDA